MTGGELVAVPDFSAAAQVASKAQRLPARNLRLGLFIDFSDYLNVAET